MMILMECQVTATAAHTVLQGSKGDLINPVPLTLIVCHSSHGHGIRGKALWAELRIIPDLECNTLLNGNFQFVHFEEICH